MKITIKKTHPANGTKIVYCGDKIIATISGEKPTMSNGRSAKYGVAWMTGRFDWHDTYGEARENAMKGHR